jgi:hypothetical protein
MTRRKPCSSRISTLAAGVVPVAQGTPAFWQMERIFWTPASTSGCVEWPRGRMALRGRWGGGAALGGEEVDHVHDRDG